MMKRRVWLLPVLALAHAALLGILALSFRASALVPAASAIAVAAVPAPVLPGIEPSLREIALLTDVPPPDFQTVDDQPAGRGNCVVDERIREALLNSPETSAALASIPSDARTVANVIMLWDGQWTSLPSRNGVDGPSQLRTIVTASIRAAPLACQEVPINGPRLVIVPDGARSVVLAFGSGTWRWFELIS